MTSTAAERLKAIMQFTELGSGFKIAMRDLEIRGAGNVLGAEQHGHMDKVGYELYAKILKEELTGERSESVELDIKATAYIPERYVESGAGRMDCYKQIADIRSLADRALERISKKENCFAAMVYKKAEGRFDEDSPHIVLHHPSDSGNLGTILRTALGFGLKNIAIIRPAVDSDDPRVVRASMGAAFSLNVRHFDSFEQYRAQYPLRRLFPFMLTGAVPLDEAVQKVDGPFSLVFGNEASGLPDEFAQIGVSTLIPHSQQIDSLNLAIAAGIGMYAFTRK